MEMNENGQMHTCGKNCMCGHRHLTKWLVRIAIVLIVFCLGFMMGELRGMLRTSEHEMYSGHGMMMHRGGMDMDGYDGSGMMDNTLAPATSATPAPATAAQ